MEKSARFYSSANGNKLFDFVNLLRNNGLVVALVGVFKRLDIPVAVATETNGYLVSWLPQGAYVKLRIARKHFLPNDRSHLNAKFVLLFLR